MKKFPLYLIFLAIDYCLMKFLPIPSQVVLFLLFIGVEGILFIAFYHNYRDVHRAGFNTFLVIVWALYFGSVAYLVRSILHINERLAYLVLFFLPWSLAFCFLMSKWLWRRIKNPQMITEYLNLLTFIVIILFGYRLWYTSNHEFFDSLTTTSIETVPGKENNAYPDIYYIILDGYGRQDTLQEYLEYDNSQFVDFLEDRGFEVADQGQANYNHTLYSIASSLNFDYISPANQPVNLMVFSQSEIFKNRARVFLADFGYQFITFYNPYSLTDITDADIYFPLKGQSKIDALRLDELLSPGSLMAIPLEANLIAPSGRFRDYQDHLLSSLNQLADVSSLPEPTFVFFHILIPHTPFIFDQNGPITPEQPYLLVRDFRGTHDERITGYLGQVKFLNQQVEQAINVILENSNEPPIIIIQGDHGPGLLGDTNPAGICLKDRTSILSAYFLPGLKDNPIYETITPVNSFRIIFNQYFGAHYELLDDKVYFDRSGESFQFMDVTPISQNPCTIH